MTNLKQKIEAAADAGILTLAHVEGGAVFENVADWLSYEPTHDDMLDALERAGIPVTDDRPDIHEINARLVRERAMNAGLIRRR